MTSNRKLALMAIRAVHWRHFYFADWFDQFAFDIYESSQDEE